MAQMNVYLDTRKGLTAIRFHSIDGTGTAEFFYTTRKGGVSEGPYESLNPGITTADSRENVEANRRLIQDAFGTYPRETVRLVHGSRVVRVSELPDEDSIPEADAAITNTRGLPLAIFYADCAGVCIVDPARRAAGLVHAGWRGTAEFIAAKTVEAMTKEFGTDPKDCVAAITPSIGPCCFEVEIDAVEILTNNIIQQYKDPWKKDLTDFISKLDKKGKYAVDLQGMNRTQLMCAGLRPENITASGLCTCCRGDLFYSYRRDKRTTGRMGAVLYLK